MITFDEGNIRFNYRVAGVALDKGRVLLQGAEGQDFWCLPGGRGEFLEPSPETLRREMIEELGVKVNVSRLLWVVENFFSGDDFSTGKDKQYHELGLYFLMEPPSNSRLRKIENIVAEDGGIKIRFKWFAIEDIDDIRVLPSFLQKELKSISSTTKHILHMGHPISQARL